MPRRYAADAAVRRRRDTLDGPRHPLVMPDAPAPPVRPLPLRVLGWLVTLAVLAVAATMLVPTLLGYGRYVLVSGSMSGTYDTGSVVYTKNVPVSTLEVGDVITYAPPAGASPQPRVTHRIAARSVRDGRIVLRTKGDANAAPDPWTFTLRDRQQAVVRFGVPYAGYAISALGDRRVRMLVVGVPAALIALLAVVGLLRDAAREAQEEQDEDDAPAAGAGPVPGPVAATVVPHTVFPHRLRDPSLTS